MKSVIKARADWRVSTSAALLGAGVGLSLGASYLAAGMAGHAEAYARAQSLAEAAASGYAGSYLEAQGPGLRAGLQLYGFRAGLDAAAGARRPADPRATAKAHRRADLECLTEAVYYEARSESASGQAAVAQVVMNRVKHPAFPKSVCAVVFQGAGRSGCQFSFACDGSMRHGREAAAWDRARRVAARALAGVIVANIGSATHYHNMGVSPLWAPQMLRVATVGVHVFYKFSPYRLRAIPGEPVVETAVLTSAPLGQAPELRLAPALVEKAVETSLQQPVSPDAKPPAAPAAAAHGAEAATLTSTLPASAAAS